MRTVIEIENEIISLKNRQDDLVLQKKDYELKLLEIKNLVRSSGKMPQDKYRTCCNSQQHHSRAIQLIEKQMSELKSKLRELSSEKYALKVGNGTATNPAATNSIETPLIVEALVQLREEYQQFSADPTRVSSMRQMDAEFVLKLNPIIKHAVGSD